MVAVPDAAVFDNVELMGVVLVVCWADGRGNAYLVLPDHGSHYAITSPGCVDFFDADLIAGAMEYCSVDFFVQERECT